MASDFFWAKVDMAAVVGLLVGFILWPSRWLFLLTVAWAVLGYRRTALGCSCPPPRKWVNVPVATVGMIGNSVSPRLMSSCELVMPESARAQRTPAMEQSSDRLWYVLRLIAADVDTMRYTAGGDRPAEVAECPAAESGLPLDDSAVVLGCGGYDPDPFVTVSGVGLLRPALCHPDGTIRLIGGERAGT